MAEQQFSPRYSEEQTRQLLEEYKGRAHLLSPEAEEELALHAQHHNVPFYTGDFSVMEAIKQAGAGFFEGFTTWNVADHPDNEYEQIFRNLGHLAGFAPSMMSAPLKAVGAAGLARKVGGWKSIPMLGADALTDYTKSKIKATGLGSVGRSEALKTAKNFYLGEKAAHMAEGAFHLGTASAISSVWGGVDAMMESALHGAQFGGIFRAIGNLTPGTSAHEKIGKSIAGSLFQGLPSTLRGATTPEQVYEYVMGAYFGGNEVSWSRKKAMDFVNKKVAKQMSEDPKFYAISRGDPEFHPEYRDLPEPVKPIAKEYAKTRFADYDEQLGMSYLLAEEMGEADKVIPDKKHIKKVEFVDGEEVQTIDPNKLPEFKEMVFVGGASEGGDTYIADAANRKGQLITHMTFKGHDKTIKSPGLKRRLKDSELEDVTTDVEVANRTLQKDLSKLNDYEYNLLRKNAYKVRFSDSVYVFDEIANTKSDNYRYEYETYKGKDGKTKTKKTSIYTGNKNRVVKGDSKWAVQMAIDKGKSVHVYDVAKKGWYTWNQGAGRFTRVIEPSKPTNRYAVLGTRSKNKLHNQNANKAINRFFNKHWMDTTTTTEKVSKAAKDDVVLSKAEKRMQTIDTLVDNIDNKIKETNDEVTIAKARNAGPDEILEISAQKDMYVKRKDALIDEYNQLSNIDVDTGVKPKPIMDAETAIESNKEISEKQDGDFEGSSDIQIGKRASIFAKKHLRKLWATAPIKEDLPLNQLEAANLVEKALNTRNQQGDLEFIKRGSRENKSEELGNLIEKNIKETYDIDYNLSESARGDLRQWIQTRNLGEMVTHLQSDGKGVNRMRNDANPRSQSGSRKHQIEPKKAIEYAFEKEGGRIDLDANGNKINPTYMVLDHVTIRTDNGKVDLDLSRYRENYLLKEAKYDKDVAEQMYNQFMSDSMQTMMKDGYYAFGGRADGDKIHWVRFHPLAESTNAAGIKAMVKEFVKIGKQTNSKFGNEYEIAKNEFVRKYARNAESKRLLEEQYDRMYMSNLLYDLSMNGFKVTKDLRGKTNQANIKKMLGDGFIKDSAAFNKRLQIWFTNGWMGDSSFIKNQIVNGKQIELNDAGKYNYIIVEDFTKEGSIKNMSPEELKVYQKTIKSLNNQNPEHTDGAIIVRDDILQAMNRDFGTTESVGQNKSFIVAPHAEHGALLGKFMFHSAGKKMSEMMRKKGNLHMIMHDSAVKQRGTRDIGDYRVDSRGLTIEAPVYEISPENVFGSYGVYGSRHMIESQRLPKQVLGNLVALSKNKVPQEVIDDMFNKVIGERFKGDEAWNAVLGDYLQKAQEGKMTPEKLREMERDIEDNIDSIGIRELVDAMKNDHAMNLTETIYRRILKLEKEDAYRDMVEGNMTEEEYSRVTRELEETNSVVDKVVAVANRWAADQKVEGQEMSSMPIYMHKFIRDYRMRAVQNFIVSSATKPKMDNSGVGFIRPYDKAMQSNLDNINEILSKNNKEGINYKDDVFLLDDSHRQIIINTDIVGMEVTTLGKLWDTYQSKGKDWVHYNEVTEILRAGTVRVPMDSISGVQVLQFGGFTGRAGHGILMHSRAMRAEGGADLDGDKSFVFFGGKGGWQKDWKDAFHSNKDEHYTPDGKSVSDNKDARITEGKYKKHDTYSNLLSQEFTDAQKEWYSSKAFQYAPAERIRISEAAVNGRNLLGPAVIQKQVMTAAYNSIVAGGGEDVFQVDSGKGKKRFTYEITVKAKTDDVAQNNQRKMSRAQLGLASDPLDVLGLKSKDEWFKYMWDSYFEVTNVRKRAIGKKIFTNVRGKELKEIKELDNPRIFRNGIYGDYLDINSAYWGRNWAEGRKYSMAEIKELGASIYNINAKPEMANNVLAKTGEVLHGIDWSDSIFGRLSKEKVEAVYTEHSKNIKEFDWLKRMLGRTSFKTEIGNYISNTMKYHLYKDINVIENGKLVGGLEAVAMDTGPNGMFQRAIRGTLFAKNKKLLEKAENSIQVRKDILRQISKYAEDFIVNDMTDLSSLNNVSRIVRLMRDEGDIGLKGAENLDDAVATIHAKVEYLKKRSYLMRRDRLNAETHAKPRESRELITDEMKALDKQLREAAGMDISPEKMNPESRKKIREIGDDLTAELDQMQIDSKIVEFKKELTPTGQRLFDHLLLSSLSRGNLNKIDSLIERIPVLDKAAMDLIHSYRSQAARTQTSKLGFNSDVVSETALKEHVGSYLSNFNTMWRPPVNAEVKKTLESIESRAGKKDFLEEAGLPDDELPRFLQEAVMESGYQGLKPSKLSAENKSLITEIATILKTYNNSLGGNLNAFLRGNEYIQKDLNNMTLEDFKVLRNYLHEAKRGGLVQRFLKKFGGKKHAGPTQFGARHWLQIPETTGRELMVDDIQLMHQNGFFTDRFGNRREGRVVKPTNFIDMLQNQMSLMVDKATGTADTFIKEFQDNIHFQQGIKDGDALWSVAIRTREKGLIKELQNNPDPKRIEEQQAIIQHLHTKFNETIKETDYKNIAKQKYFVTINGKRGELTGEQIVKEMNKQITGTMEKMHKFIRGEPGALDRYIRGYHDPSTRLSPIIDYKHFIRDMTEHLTGGPTPWKNVSRGEIPLTFGIDGLRAVARSMQLDLLPRKTKEERDIYNKIRRQPVLATGKISYDSYFPHMFFDKKVASKILENASMKIFNTPDSVMSKDEKLIELNKLQYRHRSLEGDWNFKDMEETQMFEELTDMISKKKKISESRIKWFNANERAGSMHSRTSYTAGWSIDPAVVESYIRSLSNTYHRQLSYMFGRNTLDNMYKTMKPKWGKEQAKAWQKWGQLYVNDAVGNPTIISEQLFNDPALKLKMSPYGWWADNRVRDKVNKIAGKLGLTNKNLPENLRGVDIDTIRHWSNLEAQYELAALLAHPKSMVMNVFGGSLHTIQNVGLGTFMKGRSIEYLTKINPKWKSKEDIDKFAIGHGVVPEFMLYEMGLQKAFQSTKGKTIIEDIRRAMARNPDMDVESIGEIAGRHGKDWWTKATNFASKFMTAPERMLRTNSFMAHYVHAWEKWGGAFKDYDHPFLIEQAKKGVKATQFLYNAPNRPAFARTALGKAVMRFQMYSWNSVKFRNHIKREARIMGYKEGTVEYDRFKRTTALDFMMFAMANVYMYSLFEQNLPQPYGWYQDTADWIFGDEKERDRAFYGNWPTSLAPLQAVTPVGLRMGPPVFKAMLDDDWSKVSRYTTWSMMPFGRIARDIFGEGNLRENPMRIPEKIFGFPMTEIQRQIRQAKEDEEAGIEPELIYPGSYRR